MSTFGALRLPTTYNNHPSNDKKTIAKTIKKTIKKTIRKTIKNTIKKIMPTLMFMMLLEISDSWILQETGQWNMRNRSGYGVTGCKTRFMFLSASKNCHKHLNNSDVSAKNPFPEGSTASDFRPRRFARWQCTSSSWPSPLPC